MGVSEKWILVVTGLLPNSGGGRSEMYSWNCVEVHLETLLSVDMTEPQASMSISYCKYSNIPVYM